MKKLIALGFLGCCLLPSISPAMDLKEAKFTQVFNQVEVISDADKSHHPAVVGETFKVPDSLFTGTNSRAELVAEDGTVTRVGANTIFSFDQANRTIDLKQGSVLFHAPHGKGGGTIRAAVGAGAVLGTTVIVTATPDGGFKFLVLEGQAEVTYLGGLKEHLDPGQMTVLPPGATQPSPVLIFRLDDEVKDSLLVNGFDNPLSSLSLINDEVKKQLLDILNNRLGDTGSAIGDTTTPIELQGFKDYLLLNSEFHKPPPAPPAGGGEEQPPQGQP